MTDLHVTDGLGPAYCPNCLMRWHYQKNGQRYSRLIGVEIQGEYDGVSIWKCPDCRSQWDRWSGKLMRREKAT